MANKLSITDVKVNQGLAQIKTGEFFVVMSVDLDAKKATLRSADGEEKVVSKATLERWYRELTEEEGGKVSNISNEEGTTGDEVQESNESEEAEASSTSEATGDNNADDAEGDATEGKPAEGGDVVEQLKSMYGYDPAIHASGNAGHAPDTDGDAVGSGEESDGSDSESEDGNIRDADDSDVGGVEDGSDGGDEEVTSPVTPSNAGKDKDKAKAPKKQEPKNAALMKVRQTIIDTILADSPSIQLKTTSSYDVLKEKHNFAEITHGSNRFNVSVMSKCLTEDQLNKVKVNPASFGWSIDADFTVFDESDIEMAVKLIRQSREYRLANPVTRKKAAPKSKK